MKWKDFKAAVDSEIEKSGIDPDKIDIAWIDVHYPDPYSMDVIVDCDAFEFVVNDN